MAKNSDLKLKIWYEIKDLFAGAAFPVMLQVILSVTFIGMASSLTDDLTLSIVMLVIGEVLFAVAYIIFGRMSGITSVRKLVQHAKKRELGTKDKPALFETGEYSAYKGFLIAFISCVPYIIFQFIECLVHNSFCYFVLQYIFGWAALPLTFGKTEISPWFNFLFVFFPVIVHGVAYMIGAHVEWAKQQKVAALQVGGKPEDKENKGDRGDK